MCRAFEAQQSATDESSSSLIMSLMSEVQRYGQPPKDLVSEFTPGFDALMTNMMRAPIAAGAGAAAAAGPGATAVGGAIGGAHGATATTGQLPFGPPRPPYAAASASSAGAAAGVNPPPLDEMLRALSQAGGDPCKTQ